MTNDSAERRGSRDIAKLMTLIQKLQQDYFDSLSERWNTDGTRKDSLAVFFQVTGTTPFDATVNISERIIDHSYSPLNPDVPKLTYSAEEMAQLTGLSIQFIRNDMYAGRLPSQKYGRRRLVKAQDFEAYLQSGSDGNKLSTQEVDFCDQ